MAGIIADSRTAGQRAANEIAVNVKSRWPIIWLRTPEEERATRIAAEGAIAAGYKPIGWNVAIGPHDIATGRPVTPGADYADPQQILRYIRDTKARQVWILQDLPAILQDAFLRRTLRSLAQFIAAAPVAEARTIIIITPDAKPTPDIAAHSIEVVIPPPDRDEIRAILDAQIATLPPEKRAAALAPSEYDLAIESARGLRSFDARMAYARSITDTAMRTGIPAVDLGTVARVKRDVVSRSGGAEVLEGLPDGLDSIGGLCDLKSWLVTRRDAFSPEARAYGLPAPRGFLVVGPPGCGKSEVAKAAATALGRLPLLKVDLGSLKSKYVGESEGNLRAMFQTALAAAPCVLWIDEIEKGLAGATQGAADGGVSADVLGALLTFMQESGGKGVFIIATANDVTSLPPEMLRKGRWDEVWSVDLPTRDERAEILAVALRKASRDPATIDLGIVADATDTFTGAEVAALVTEGLYLSFADKRRPLATADLLAACRTVVPLARTSRERINAIREWARTRARPASGRPGDDESPAPEAPSLDLGSMVKVTSTPA